MALSSRIGRGGLVLVLCLSGLGVMAVRAQEKKAALFPGKVQVRVSANAELKTLISSYILRELRDIKDVEIVEDDAQWQLNAVALATKNQSGAETGYAISTVVLRRVSPDSIVSILKLTQEQQLLKSLFQDYSVLRDHQIRVFPKNGLKQVSEEIVAEFDSEQLEPLRKSIKNLENSK